MDNVNKVIESTIISKMEIKSNNINLYNEILNYEINIPSKKWGVLLYHYINEIKNVPTCYCGNVVKFKSPRQGYREFCSKRCMYDSSEIKKKKKETCMSIYGVDNPSKSPIIRKKVEETNLKIYGETYPLKNKKILNKMRNDFMEKYGVNNPSQLTEVVDKRENTMMDKYGVSSYSKHDDYIIKSKSTKLEKYGDENYNNRDKYKKTNIIKYGVDNPMKLDLFKDKVVETNIKIYGFSYSTQCDIVKEKSKETCFLRYGVSNPSQLPEVTEKRKKTILKKYGVDNVSKLSEVKKTISDKVWTKSEHMRKELFDIAKDINYIEYKNDSISIFKCDMNNDHNFEIRSDLYYSRIKNNTPICTICNKVTDNSSYKENRLYEFIKEIYGSNVIKNYKNKYEIDIYLPELHLGFEFNGLYWHSELYKDKNYHINKTNYFKEKGIRIIHIWEDDWDHNQEIIKSQIKNLLNINIVKYFARKSTIRNISKEDCKEFLENNHLQGNDRSIIKLGLFIREQLISVMTFDKYAGRNKLNQSEWNLSRFCSKKGSMVIGGASKLFKYFLDNHLPTKIISYADRTWSEGNLYKKLGFNLDNLSRPDYKYIVEGKRKHKSNFKKSKLKTNLTEREYMLRSGIYRIYDCGKLKFIYNNHI